MEWLEAEAADLEAESALDPLADEDHRLGASARAGPAGAAPSRLPRSRGLPGPALLRLAAREADRPRSRPPGGDRRRALGHRRVPDRGRAHHASPPRSDPLLSGLPLRRLRPGDPLRAAVRGFVIASAPTAVHPSRGAARAGRPAPVRRVADGRSSRSDGRSTLTPSEHARPRSRVRRRAREAAGSLGASGGAR